MVTCAVPGCNSSKKENPQKYTFHIFPKSIDVRQKWLKMVDRKDWVPKRNSTICSKHFESKCFPYRGSQRKKLCSGSVPTLFMPVVLKPIRKASTYIYRNISPVPCTSAGNVTNLDNALREKKLKKIIEALKKRLHIKQKMLKNLRAQKLRSDRKVLYLSQFIKVHLTAVHNYPHIDRQLPIE